MRLPSGQPDKLLQTGWRSPCSATPGPPARRRPRSYISPQSRTVGGRDGARAPGAGALKKPSGSATRRSHLLARADLARADLARADLARADLARADLARADLAVPTWTVPIWTVPAWAAPDSSARR